MIRLFNGTEIDFTHHGIEVLDDIVISSYTDWKENSKWVIEAKFKRDFDKSENINNDMILKVPTEKGEQLFKILKINKQNRKYITVYGHAIGHDFNDNFVQDINIVEKSGRFAMQQISNGTVKPHRYNLTSNIDKVMSARMVRKNGIDALLGSKDNTFISRWGGYLVLNNFNIAMNSSVGTDKGVDISIGKNVIDYDGTIDETSVVTGINAITYDGITLPEGIYYSPLVGNYSNEKIKEFKFDTIKYKYSNNNTNEEGYETLEEVYEAIRNACKDLYNVSNIDKPTCSLRINIAALEHTDQYKGDELNERIFQGDILTANLDDYGFNVKLKMIANRYDNVRNRYIDIDLGDAKSNVLSNISNVENIINQVVDQLGGNTWQDILDKAMDEAAQLIAEGIKDSYVVARKNEILIMDSPEVESAINVIRMNKNGIAFSQNGYNGPFTLAITIDGKINASCIMTGELNAALIKAGILSDATGKFSINMETGSFRFNNSVVDFHDNGLKISMADGEGAQGYSNIAYDGLGIYDSNNNRKAWFGSGDSAYIKELTADKINNRHLLKWSENRPTNFYIAGTSTGDGTGRDTNNKSNSINHTLEWIKENYGVYSYKKDIKFYIDGDTYYEDIYIGGWLGSGVITFNFDNNATWYGNHIIEDNSMYVYFNGRRWNDGQWINEGCKFIKRNNNEYLFHVRNCNVTLRECRALNDKWLGNGDDYRGYEKTFLLATSGAKVFCFNNDVVGFANFVQANDGSEISIYRNRGHNYVMARTVYGGVIKAEAENPLYKVKTADGEACSYIEKNLIPTNSFFDIKPTPSEPEVIPPTTSSQHFEQSFALGNLRTVPEGSGSSTSGRNGEWGQGSWGVYKAHRGFADLGDNPSSWASGGSNFVVELTLTRSNTSHGNAGATPVPKIKLPNGSYWNCGVGFARGQTSTVTLPSELAGAIASGSVKTLEMWSGSSNNDYSFYNYSSIKIKCEKEV